MHWRLLLAHPPFIEDNEQDDGKDDDDRPKRDRRKSAARQAHDGPNIAFARIACAKQRLKPRISDLGDRHQRPFAFGTIRAA